MAAGPVTPYLIVPTLQRHSSISRLIARPRQNLHTILSIPQIQPITEFPPGLFDLQDNVLVAE